MGLLEDYETLIKSIKTISDEIPELQDQINLLQQEIIEARNKKSQLQMERTQQRETLRSTKLKELTDAECERIAREQAEVSQQITALESTLAKDIQNINENPYNNKLADKYDLLSQINQTLASYRCRQEIPEELEGVVANALAGQTKYTDAQLRLLIEKVTETSVTLEDIQQQVNEDIGSKITDFISLKAIQNSKLSDSTKFYCYFGYVIGLLALCWFVPWVPIAATGITAAICYTDSVSDNKTLLEFILPFSRLSDGAKYLEEQINLKVSKLRKADIAKTQDKYKRKVTPLQEQMAKLREEYNQAPQKVIDTVSTSDLEESVDKEFAALLEQCDDRIEEAEKQIELNNTFIEHNQSRLPELKEKRKAMLLEIKDAYLNPKDAGSSKTLAKSFFLGIDDVQGSLIEFRYEGKSTLIIYKGASCRVNKDLISMMLMQILSTMSLTVLDIHLVDLKSAGTDYAVFFRKELQDRMHLYATDDDVKNAINILHDLLILRTQEVLTEAESLIAYNDKMLANKSLPMEYVLLFLQDPTIEQMESQEFQQLLYNGPTVGIIPIIFVNHEDLNYMKDLSRDDGEKLSAFYKAFESSIFIFDGMRSDLVQQNELLSAILTKIQKGIR